MRLLTLFLFVFFGLVKAEVIRVYAAADLQFALRELADTSGFNL